MDFKQFLKTLPAFENLKASDIEVLSAQMVVSSQPAGHTFITQGVQGEAVYLLVDGTVQSAHVDEATGVPQEPRDLHAGEMFGLLSLVENMPAGRTSVAKSDVTVAALSQSVYKGLFQVAPAIAHHLQYMVAVRLARDLQARNRELRELLQQRTIGTAA